MISKIYNKKLLIFLLGIIGLSLHLILPLLEFNYNGKLFMFSYDFNYGEFEENQCYNENVSYNKQRDISIIGWEHKKVLFGFYQLTFDYVEGNLCDYEYYLEQHNKK